MICSSGGNGSNAAPHMHRLHQLSVVEAGSGIVEADGNEWQVRAGDVAYHPWMTLHMTRGDASWRCRTFSFDASFAGQCGCDHGLPRATTVMRQGDFAVQLLQLHRRLEAGTTRSSAADLFAPLGEAAADAACVIRTRREVPGAITRCLRELHSAYADRLMLDDLAQIAALSKFHLVRLFGRFVGATPHAYIIWLRLAHARALHMTGETGSRAAYEAGFADQGHFIRTCRRLLGMTPTRARVLEAALPRCVDRADRLAPESRQALARLWQS